MTTVEHILLITFVFISGLIIGLMMGLAAKKETQNFSITRTEQELKQINTNLEQMVSIMRQKLGM